MPLSTRVLHAVALIAALCATTALPQERAAPWPELRFEPQEVKVQAGAATEPVVDNARLGIPQRRFVTDENKARELGDGLDRIRDPHVRMSLSLQQAFGLRREECIKFRPR
jgi:hypothetical protein